MGELIRHPRLLQLEAEGRAALERIERAEARLRHLRDGDFARRLPAAADYDDLLDFVSEADPAFEPFRLNDPFRAAAESGAASARSLADFAVVRETLHRLLDAILDDARAQAAGASGRNTG
jgi:hypothetical protein